jgi:SAM-dependent methyltransferase
MNFFDLVDIAEQHMELINPTSPEKLIKAGEVMGLSAQSQVIDFGSGFGEMLALWGERFGISAVGIDIRETACERARSKLAERGMADRIEIVAGKGDEYEFKPKSYDVAACVGASFIWGGFAPAVRGLKRAIKPGGKILIGEPYWTTSSVPIEYARQEPSVHTEDELLQIIRREDLALEYMLRSSRDEWDRYESENWRGLASWIKENPNHPEVDQVRAHFHEHQDRYILYGKEYMGWALYILS